MEQDFLSTVESSDKVVPSLYGTCRSVVTFTRARSYPELVLSSLLLKTSYLYG
jgi:hypothetical protein